MTLRKDQIVETVNKCLGPNAPKKKAASLVETLIEIIKKTLESGEDVMISNFGKLHVADKTERMGRNPATGKSMKLKKRRVVTFKVSQSLKTKMNESRPLLNKKPLKKP